MKLVEGWPALLVEKPEKALIISDIHFGFEAELAERGVRIPSQTWKLANRLAQLIRDTGARRLIVLGDIKHKVPLSSWIEWREMPKAIEGLKALGVKITLIPGNHDGGIKSILGDSISYASSRGLFLEAERRLLLFHGHRWPSPEAVKADIIVMGHLHPMVSLRTDVGSLVKHPAWLMLRGSRKLLAQHLSNKLKKPLKAAGRIELIVLPAFNPLLTGISVNSLSPKEKLWPLMASKAFQLKEAEVILLNGERLGTVEQLEHQLKRDEEYGED